MASSYNSCVVVLFKMTIVCNCNCMRRLKGTNTYPNGHMGKQKLQTVLMVEIYSKGLVRTIGKVFLMTFY